MAAAPKSTAAPLPAKLAGLLPDPQGPRNLMLLAGGAMIMVGFGFKLSLVPFHLWTPDVYEGAPAPVTGFLATVSKGAVLALALRYFITSGVHVYDSLVLGLSLTAVLSILVGNWLALMQQNVKRILAYSSIAHFGYVLVGMVAAEFFLSPSGLGQMIMMGSQNFDTGGMLAAILLIVLLGVVLMDLGRLLESRFAAWRGSSR